MMNDRNAPARPEQPGDGGFQAPSTDDPDSKRIGSFGDADELESQDEPDREAERVGQFSDGNETLPDDTREGRYSDSGEAATR
jgi:hypothetical protein